MPRVCGLCSSCTVWSPRLFRIFLTILSQLGALHQLETEDSSPFNLAGFNNFFQQRYDYQPENWWKLISFIVTSAMERYLPEVRSKLLTPSGIYSTPSFSPFSSFLPCYGTNLCSNRWEHRALKSCVVFTTFEWRIERGCHTRWMCRRTRIASMGAFGND